VPNGPGVPDMDFRRYTRLFRRYRLLIFLSVAVCGITATIIASTKPPTYAAHIQMFISTNARSGSLGDTYEGGLFVEQRMPSYTSFATSAAVIQRVITQLRLRDSVQHLQSEMRASNPARTVLVDVTVSDRTPARAQAIANALGAQFSAYVSSLETPQASGQPSVKATVITPASRPATPVSPRKLLDIALGVLLGLVLGTVGAVTLEALDDRIREEEDVAPIVGAPIIGAIVHYAQADQMPLVVLEAPGSVAAESFRRLRTNLTALARHQAPASFVICSAVPGDGKTLVTANLALAYAQAGRRVVIVNADLRRPRLAQLLGVSTTSGLSSVLEEDASVDTTLYTSFSPSFELLNTGPLPADPGEMLASSRFAELMTMLGARADIVLVDAPALLVAADAAIIAGAVSGAIMVARAGATRSAELKRAMDSLRLIGTPVIGAVLNAVPPRDFRQYSRYRDGPGRPRGSGEMASRVERFSTELDVARRSRP
jgi:polysaccharide biosynthesis transport protein